MPAVDRQTSHSSASHTVDQPLPDHAPLVGRMLEDMTPAPPPNASLVGLCTADRHPVLEGRVEVSWTDARGAGRSAWCSVVRGVAVQRHDQVLMQQPDNWPEPLVVAAIDGVAPRREPETAAGPQLTVGRRQTVRLCADDGTPLVEVGRGESGPVVRLLCADVDLDLGGALSLTADSIALRARAGSVDLRASDDVNVRGEMIHLNG